MIDLTEWKFVKRDVMRSKTVGDWDTEKKEIVAWSGLDEVTCLEVWAHELVEMILCTLSGVDDAMLLKYDKCHDFAREVSDRIVYAAGRYPPNQEKNIIDFEERVKHE
jgi:hypothetical protein